MPIDQQLLIPTLKTCSGLPSETIADIVALAGGGATTLGELTDVTLTAPAADQILSFDGLVWRNNAAIDADPDSLVTLFHDINAGNGKRLNADSLGASVQDAASPTPRDNLLRLTQGAFVVTGQAQFGFVGSDDLRLENVITTGGDVIVTSVLGSSVLQESGITRIETTVDGGDVTGTLIKLDSAAAANTRFSALNTVGGVGFAIEPSGKGVITQRTSGDVLENVWLDLVRDGAVGLRFNNVEAAKTTSDGLGVLPSSGVGSTALRLLDAADVTLALIFATAAGNMGLRNQQTSGEVRVESAGSDAALRNSIRVGGAFTATALAFHDTPPIVKPTLTGSRAGNAAVASIATTLANYGLAIDSTTA